MAKDVAVENLNEIVINKWDVNAAKHALDDATKEIMKAKFDLKENFRLIDIRLMLCTASVLFTVVALIYDYIYPYPESFYVLVACILSYFIATSILSWHTYFIEGNIFFVGIQPDKTGLDPPNKWTLASHVKKYNPDYRLTVSFVDGTTKEKSMVEVTKTINCFFDDKGKLCRSQLESFILNVCKDVTSKKKD
ncbi:unnamed protein product [Mesocestoides corti]|uniref:Signal peptidase complex subunit 2 n=1 Tax=Mesocestoides corti TaxID=53468 RepID=A0A0R3UBA6_MESCO|nr:unnamed protein product [Mesocestoides corti]